MTGSLPATTYRLALLPRPLPRRGLAARLVPSDVGCFPRADGHARERPHGCAQLVIMVCTAGAGWFRLRGATGRVRAGEAVVLPPHQAHVYGADPDQPWTIWWVHLAGSEMPALQRELPWLAGGRLGLADHRPAVRSIARMLAAIEQGHDQRHLDAASLAAWQLVAGLGEQTLGAATAPHADGVARAILFMHEHIADPLTIAGLARVAGWSPSHFAARFKAVTGVSVLDHFLRLRMERAAWMLDDGATDIAAVARALGYDDPFYFSRRFRAVHGCPPSAWRPARGAGG